MQKRISFLQKTFKLFIYSLISTIGIVILYLLFAYLLALIPVNTSTKNDGAISIYILTNGVHTDIVVPVKNNQLNWQQWIKPEHTKSQDSTLPYLAIGWGDKGFYLDTPTWADLKASTAFEAVTGLGTTALHATYYKEMMSGGDCRRIQLTAEQYDALCQFIIDSFEKNEDGQSIHIETNANYGQNDVFYEAIGSYSLFKTCNTWSNSALKAAGLKACLWTPFKNGIFQHYQSNIYD